MAARVTVGHYTEGRGDGTPHGGFYTKADLAEIVAYAAQRFVTVCRKSTCPGTCWPPSPPTPSSATPGRQFEVYTRWGISDHVLNLDERTIRFCKDVLDEVTGIFPSPYVHIGGDECPRTEWEASPQPASSASRSGLAGAQQLQSWFSRRWPTHWRPRAG